MIEPPHAALSVFSSSWHCLTLWARTFVLDVAHCHAESVARNTLSPCTPFRKLQRAPLRTTLPYTKVPLSPCVCCPNFDRPFKPPTLLFLVCRNKGRQPTITFRSTTQIGTVSPEAHCSACRPLDEPLSSRASCCNKSPLPAYQDFEFRLVLIYPGVIAAR